MKNKNMPFILLFAATTANGLAELQQERAQKFDAQKALIAERKKSETKVFTDEQKRQFNDLQSEIDNLDERIEEERSVIAAEKRAAANSGTPVDTGVSNKGEEKEHARMMEKYSIHRAIRSQMPNGRLEGVEAEIHQETVRKAQAAGVQITGIAIPSGQKRADGQTVTQDSGNYGGNLVAENQQGIIEKLRPTPILENLGARFITGLQGDVAFPTNDGGITASWEGEVTTVTPSKNAYGKKTMKPNRLAVNALISLQNLFQSSEDLESMTIDDIRNVVSNEIDAKAINGSGVSNQPLGILNTSGVNTVAAGTNGGAPTWNHVVDMESQVFIQNANAARMAYLINPATKGKLKTTKHSAGDLNYLMAMNNEMNGYNVGVSNHVPGGITKGTGTNLQAGIFGDFSQLIMGQWGFYDLTVDNVSRKADGYVALIVNTFVDVLVRQDKSFTVVKDWDIS